MAFQEIIKLTDEELVGKITESNNTHLFGSLYDRFVSIVYNKCLSFVSSKEEAQDLTHDIFVKLFVKLKTYNGKAKFSTWLYAFVYNHCVNYLQREQKNQKNTFSLNDDLQEDIVEEISDREILELKSEKLMVALRSINPNQKAFLLMKYQDGLSIKEMASLYELGESAVKMRLSRAKMELMNVYKTL